MATRPHKKRRKGSLGAVQMGLFTMFQRHVELVEESDDPEICARSASVAVQLAFGYLKLIETTKLAKEMAEYEHLLGRGNGYGR